MSKKITVYNRQRDLLTLLPLWNHELEILTKKNHDKLLRHIKKTLKAERLRGISGHWSYNFTRHANLLNAYRTEQKLSIEF